MARGQLPKAYLRIDPDLPFTHPDPAAFMRLLSVANKQPYRGRFKEWSLIESVLGKATARRLRERRDIIPVDADGNALDHEKTAHAAFWYVDGWDHWQEGDLDVGQRMRLVRERRRNGHRNEHSNAAVTGCVTEPQPEPSPPSEASGVRRPGVKASGETTATGPAGDGADYIPVEVLRCPDCRRVAVVRQKAAYVPDGQPPGWVCSRRRNGCGMEFHVGEPALLAQLSPQQIEAVKRSAARARGQSEAAPDTEAPTTRADTWLKERGLEPTALAVECLDWLALNRQPGEMDGSARPRWLEERLPGCPPDTLPVLQGFIAREKERRALELTRALEAEASPPEPRSPEESLEIARKHLTGGGA